METQIEFSDINGNLLPTTANETIISGVTDSQYVDIWYPQKNTLWKLGSILTA